MPPRTKPRKTGPKRSDAPKAVQRAKKAARPKESFRRLSPEERRAQIIEVVEELFKTRPYEELGVPDVAKACGITQGLVYHYFPTKEQLFLATFTERANELLAACTPSLSQNGASVASLVERGVKGYVDYVEAHELAYLNLFRSPTAPEPQIWRICEETRWRIVDHFLTAFGLADAHLPATRLSLRGYLGHAENVILLWLEKREVSRPVLEKLLFSAVTSAFRAGLLNDPETPFSPAAIAQVDAELRGHFKLA